ncbi:hypothetical protein [Mesorhizobium sp. SP-1A]|uniref:hypothetical protein n=1 Tax=Mesorhizobium sp. SP-1A TaxID=3077840 RepID=UPI0028F6FBB8|nr:hypothetical protein [Mesorhizobium sp. SP-1A]
MQQGDPDERVETIFRNGTLTVVGVVLAFSLGFVSHWAGNPVPWQLYDGFALVPILAGIGLQIKALAALLDHDCLKRPVFERANRIFMRGLLLTSGGVALAVTLDYLEVSKVAKLLN